MLKIKLDKCELWDSEKEEFLTLDPIELRLEHSLLSISKWESIWTKPFYDNKKKVGAELYSYILCMNDVDIETSYISFISNDQLERIINYIDKSQSATKIYYANSQQNNKPKSHKPITSEEIYAKMIQYNIPFECEKWHISRLLKLIETCKINNTDDNKMSKRDVAAMYKRMNSQRRK